MAIRAGAAPQEPDNVAQPLVHVKMGLYASPGYVAQHGLPAGPQDFARHRFIGADAPESRAPFHRWMQAAVPEANIVFRVTDAAAREAAVRAGLGLGFHTACEAQGDAGLIEAMAPIAEWDSPLWIVTHVDLHRTVKVQSFLSHLKAAAAGWKTL